jgi:hypothetical protein
MEPGTIAASWHPSLGFSYPTKAQLQKLEQNKAIGRACPVCCERLGLTPMVDVTPLPDGMLAYGIDVPKPCKRCGVVPESIIEIVEVVVEGQASGCGNKRCGFGRLQRLERATGAGTAARAGCEWFQGMAKTDAKQKQPYFIRQRDDKPLAIAGLWEAWNKGEEPVEFWTILPTAANDMMAARMTACP